ncbi:MAG: peptidase M52 [Catenulispora sp.]
MTAAGPPVVIGVGEDFRHDDGVGPAVVAELRRLAALDVLPPDTRLSVCFGEPAALIELWRDARLAIVVDAAAASDEGDGDGDGTEAKLTAGDVVRWEVGADDHRGRPAAPSPDPPPTIGPGPAATHGLGPGAAIALARILDRLPARLVLVAVVGADFSPGPGLSEPVAQAVRRVARDIARELGRESLSALSDEDLLSWSGSGSRPTLEP